MTEVIMFYLFAGISLFAGLGVLLHPNPVMSVLHLVAAMIGVAGLFFNLGAPFIAWVQILVYAGAVVILFLFILMIFDIKTEGKQIFSYGAIGNGLKILFGGSFAGLLLFSILFKDNIYYAGGTRCFISSGGIGDHFYPVDHASW